MDEQKQKRIRTALDNCATMLKKEGVKYFLGAVDKQPKDPDGGRVFAQSEISGEEFIHVLDVALPTKQDAINLGIWVGQILNARNNEKVAQALNSKKDRSNEKANKPADKGSN